MEQHVGVKGFDNARGYCLLQRNDDPDVFVHHSSIWVDGYRTVKREGEVEFYVIQGKQGLHADTIKRVAR